MQLSELENNNSSRKLQVDDIVKHFKSEIRDKSYVYKILAISLNCSSEETEFVVTYQEMFGEHRTFVRNYDEFMGFVDFTKYPEIKQKHRFEIIGHDSSQTIFD